MLGSVDPHHDRRFTVEPGDDISIFETIRNPGDIPEMEDRAVSQGDQGQFFELTAGVPLAHGLYQDFAPTGLDGSPGQIDAARPDRGHNLVKGEIIPAQVRLRHFDGDFVIARAHQFDQRDRPGVDQVIPDLLGCPPEELFGYRSVNADSYGRILVDDLHDDRIFGLFRKGVDQVDLGLHVIEDRLQVSLGIKFHRNRTQIFVGPGADFGDALDPLDLLFNLDADPFFDLLGAGARVGHRHIDHVQFKLGEHFAAHAQHGKEPGHDNKNHDQVYRNMVIDRPAGEGFHEVQGSRFKGSRVQRFSTSTLNP